jgi:DNA-binding NarL/FixJ family response regulator
MHLECGTHAENQHDKAERGRAARLCGESNGSARLAEADVRRVFEMRAQGMTQSAIGAELGVAQRTVSDVLRGKTWAHLAA